MNLSEHIFKHIVPELGQQFITYAESHPDNYHERVQVIKGMECFIYKFGQKSKIFKYSVSNSFWEDIGEFREIEFWLDGQYCVIQSCINECLIYLSDLGFTAIIGDDTVNGTNSIEDFTELFNQFIEQEKLTEQAINY